MSLSQQTIHRLPTIKAELLKGSNYETIGETLGVTERTIDRDIKAFVDSGAFETWLKEEWLRLHTQIIHDDPTEAYRNITKLISHLLTRKVDIKEDVTIRTIEVYADWSNKHTDNQSPVTTTNPTVDKPNSTKTPADSES